MTNLSRPASPIDEPFMPRSLGTLAAALVSCVHPERSQIAVAIDLPAGGVAAMWCAACCAHHAQEEACRPH
jgi:hypothetical protein